MKKSVTASALEKINAQLLKYASIAIFTKRFYDPRKNMPTRADGRENHQLRTISIVPGVNPYAEGSAEVCFGNTKLLVTASLEQEVPPWMKANSALSGWITAEYGMLPRSTHTRNKREAAQGKQSGRTLEIQRLIGRALRAALPLELIPGLTLKLDCDVLTADGGTRTAAISGGWVALAQAIEWGKTKGLVAQTTILKQVAAVSAGIIQGTPMLDLCYEEDSQADFDLNVILDGSEHVVEIQGTAERENISFSQFHELVSLAGIGIRHIFELQNQAIRKFKSS